MREQISNPLLDGAMIGAQMLEKSKYEKMDASDNHFSHLETN